MNNKHILPEDRIDRDSKEEEKARRKERKEQKEKENQKDPFMHFSRNRDDRTNRKE